MTPNELYARKPVEVVRDNLDALKGYDHDHLPEVDAQVADLASIVEGPLKGRFELRFYRRHSVDERRVWWLYALYFDGAPVMVLQNAGREGDDHSRRIVTDQEKLARVVMLLRSHLPVESIDVVDPASDVKGLDEFYGDSLGSEIIFPAGAIPSTATLKVTPGQRLGIHVGAPGEATSIRTHKTDISIQWQGTHVCGDFHCECGAYAHVCDATGMFTIRCHKCGVVWDVPSTLTLERSPNLEGDVDTDAFVKDDE